MKKVVITGATGMIGVSLVNQLVSNGIFCLLLVKKEYIKPNTLPVSDLCKVEECDLHDLEKFDYKDKDFDVFIHLGWMSTIGLGRDDAFLQEKNISVDILKCHISFIELLKNLFSPIMTLHYNYINY